MHGRVDKSRARVCTRSERPVTRRNGLITGPDCGDDLKSKENCTPSAADGNWTKPQEKALQESLSTIKPGVNFWRSVAGRVPGKSAEDCFDKFYSGRTTTRAAKRIRTSAELDFSLADGSSSKRVKSFQSNASVHVKTPGRERRATRQAVTRPAKSESKTSGNGYNAGALTRQAVVTGTKGTKRSIEASSNSSDVKRIKVIEPESKANGGTFGQRARKGSKNRIEKQIENQTCTPSVALASVFARSSDSGDGDGSDSASGAPVDDDLWTQEQEKALQNAYATAKPSANFWHLISRRVPGRSAEECFNKFYSAHPTPPRAPQRSCLKEVDCQPLLPRLSKAKNTGGKRLLEAHRTVRNVLRKQQVNDEDYKADAFAALEPPDVVHDVMHNVPDMSNEIDLKFCFNSPLPGITESNTTQYLQSIKENLKPKPGGQSREFGIGQSRDFSPDILKKVKDPLMLDKYIDHLHQRRTRRAGTKSSQKRANAQRAREVYELSKNCLDFMEVRLDAIHRAKQELRDIFLRPSSAVDDPFLNLLDESSDGIENDDEEDGESVHSQVL